MYILQGEPATTSGSAPSNVGNMHSYLRRYRPNTWRTTLRWWWGGTRRVFWIWWITSIGATRWKKLFGNQGFLIIYLCYDVNVLECMFICITFMLLLCFKEENILLVYINVKIFNYLRITKMQDLIIIVIIFNLNEK